MLLESKYKRRGPFAPQNAFRQYRGAFPPEPTMRRSNVQVKAITDPSELVNNFISLGEWNTDGDLEDWTTNTQVAASNVASGILSGSSSGNDPQLNFGGLAIGTDNGANQIIIEMRFRRQSTDTACIDLFWADEAGGFGGPRRALIADNAWPSDGEFHVVQFPIGQFISGNLATLRFDPLANNPNSTSFALDYVRIGIIDADDDNDGLVNSVETNTGIFNSASDTGTDPNNDDLDGDTFLDGNEVAFGTDPNDINDFPAPTIVSYSDAPASYIVGGPISPNVPSIVNGTPVGFSIEPFLPAARVGEKTAAT